MYGPDGLAYQTRVAIADVKRQLSSLCLPHCNLYALFARGLAGQGGRGASLEGVASVLEFFAHAWKVHSRMLKITYSRVSLILQRFKQRGGSFGVYIPHSDPPFDLCVT